MGPEAGSRVRAALREVLAEYGTQAKTAKALGVTQQTVSNVLHGRQPGPDLAVRVATLRGVTVESLLGAGDPVVARDVAVALPVLATLPGWIAAEQIARQAFPRVPEEAWLGARGLSGARLPDGATVTCDVVLAAARLWQALEEAAVPVAAQAAPSGDTLGEWLRRRSR